MVLFRRRRFFKDRFPINLVCKLSANRRLFIRRGIINVFHRSKQRFLYRNVRIIVNFYARRIRGRITCASRRAFKGNGYGNIIGNQNFKVISSTIYRFVILSCTFRRDQFMVFRSCLIRECNIIQDAVKGPMRQVLSFFLYVYYYVRRIVIYFVKLRSIFPGPR